MPDASLATGRETPELTGLKEEPDPGAPLARGAIGCVVAVAASVMFGVVVSLTQSRVGTQDLWYDDSWVALSQRVPLSQAIHMGVGAPGFTIVMRWWMGLADGSIPWAQSFAVVPLLFTPFIIWIAARVAGASRVASTLIACLCAISPMLLLESARVKQYTWEYALSAALVAVAAAVRRDGPTLRWTIVAACTVVVGVLFSFVLLFPAVLVYVVVSLPLVREATRGGSRLDLRRIAVRTAVLGGAGLVVLVWTQALLPNPPDRLQDHWRIGFLGASGSLTYTLRQSVVLARGFWGAFFYRGSSALLIIPVAILVWFVVRRWRTTWWLLLAPLLAIALSAFQLYPLGSIVQARVDAWLIPWIAVVLALAVSDFGQLSIVQRILERVPQSVRFVALGAVVVLLGAGVALDGRGYPPTRAGAAVAAIGRSVEAGEPTYVAKNDWPVNLLLPGPITIVDDRSSESQFSVVLDDQPRTLHVDDTRLAARELRPACGRTATIVGVTTETLRPVLTSVGCPVTNVRFATNRTGLPHDNVVTVTFAPVQASATP